MEDQVRRGALLGALGLLTTLCALNDVGQLGAAETPVLADRIETWGNDAFSRLPLVDQQGESFTLRSLRGTPVVLTFVASRCTDTCPIVNALFARLAERAARDHVRVRLVTVTLDPQYDRPVVMSRLATALHADRNQWLFATGSSPDIAALERAFGVVSQTDGSGIPEAHSALAYELDARGAVRRTLPFSDRFSEAVVRDLQQRVPIQASVEVPVRRAVSSST